MSLIAQKYEQRVNAIDSLVCVGLDSDLNQLPAEFQYHPTPQFAFNRAIIDATHPYASAYKLNSAFYEARGAQGWQELQLTIDYLRAEHPDIVTICDAKRADIGSTSSAYARAVFDTLGFDAITLHPYLGAEALAPFLERDDKASIILCRTSNPQAGEFQDVQVSGHPLWAIVAERVATHWNTRHNCMLVVGATYPQELAQVRALVGDMNLLIPGIGAQGGSIRETVLAGRTTRGRGMLINSSRAIIFSPQPAQSALELRDAIRHIQHLSASES